MESYFYFSGNRKKLRLNENNLMFSSFLNTEMLAQKNFDQYNYQDKIFFKSTTWLM